MTDTKLKGNIAEDLACKFLLSNGLKLVTRNFNSRYGEIDLIMRDKESLVFVEVRSRKNTSLVDAAASVDTRKQRKLIRTAQFFLQKNNLGVDTYTRFDIIAITNKQQQAEIDWLKNAFTA